MIVDLHTEAGLDPSRVGAKAAWLAMGARVGLPILPGLVVEAAESRGHMRLAAKTLPERGSGGARLALTAEPLAIAEELVMAGRRLGENLVARSSTGLEGWGEWSGAFASYLELTPEDLPKAVVGCWASAFAVDALEREKAAGVEPGSFRMAVLVQPALTPAAGGTATIDDEGTVRVTAVKGSPAPLLQGWSGGHDGYSPTAGEWHGDDLIELVGPGSLDEIAVCMRMAKGSLDVNRCEWALDGRVWILQLGVSPPAAPAPASPLPTVVGDPRLTRIARLVTRVGGGLGDELILPWALAGLPETTPSLAATSPHPLSRARELRDELVAQVWGLPAPEAMDAARACTTGLLGPDPIPALDRISGLRPPDESLASKLIGLVEDLRWRDDTGVTRRGVGRWEPFVAAVVFSAGDHQQGIAASPGIGAGLRCDIGDPGDTEMFAPRAVITSPRPIPNLAALLWDAAGIVTATGSPSAHLYESARALGIPSVSGVEVPEGERIVAIDGNSGLVASLALNGDGDV